MDNQPPLMPTQEPPAPALPRYRDAFERTHAEIQAVPATKLVHINVDVMGLVELARNAAARALVYKERAAAVLLDFDVSYFDVLETRALALGHAQARHLAACRDRDEIPALSQRGRELRARLRADIAHLIRHELMPEGALDRLTNRRAHKSVGFDLLALVQLLRAHWHDIEGRTAIREPDLTDAERLAERLVHKLATRKESSAAIRAAAHTRAQAFALLVEAYGQVRRAMMYLRYDEGDADKIIPSPYRGRAKQKRKRGRDSASAMDQGMPTEASATLNP